MAIIAPNTDVYLLKNVPLNNDYENTFYFNSATEQFNYFYPKRAYTKVNYTFQRNNGMLRVDVPAESAMQCNYLMYRNTNYGNKWFYAFINNVHYVNNEMSEIQFELDVIQTWLFDFMNVTNNIGTIDNCFIERQHATRDRIGDNLIPEGFDIGDEIYNGNFVELPSAPANINAEDKRYVIILGYTDANGDGGVYISRHNFGVSGLKLLCCYPSDAILNDFLRVFLTTGQPEAVQFIQFVPALPFIASLNSTQIADLEAGNGLKLGTTFGEPVPVNLTIPKLTGTEGLDGYVPYNKKLYTYPYNSLVLTDGAGNYKNYRYEYFNENGNSIHFNWYCNTIPNIESHFMPVNYNNITGKNYSDAFIVDDYGQGSWTNDAFQAWIAKNKYGFFGDIIRAINPFTRGGSGWNIMDTMHKAYVQGDEINGTKQVKGANELGFKSIYYNRVSLRYQYAQRIDQYFNMYGYAQNIVDKPVLNARSRYTYVKTRGCDIHPNIPTFYLKQICEKFNKGIRFWVDKTYFQDYALDNAPIFQ